MQTISTELILGIAGIVFLIIAIIYWYKFEKPTRLIQSRREGLYFDPPEFRRRAVAQTFEWFMAKWNKNIILFLVLASLSIVVPRFILPDPYNFMISIVCTIVSLVGMMYYKEVQEGKEVQEFTNKPVGTSITHYPDVGDNSELWRKMDDEGEIQLDTEQMKVVASMIVEKCKTLPTYNPKEINLIELEKLWIEKMGNMHINRVRIDDDFRILLISPHSFEESKTQGTKNMIARTIHIDLQQIPMFTIYAGITKKIFASRDEDDRKIFLDKTMGIYVVQYDIKSRDEDMMTGKHKIMTKGNALLADAIHLIEQDQSTAKEMTKTLRDMEKANQDYDESDFDSKAESHRIIQGSKNAMDAMGSFSRPTRVKSDAILIFVVAVVFICLGISIGFTWGLLSGVG